MTILCLLEIGHYNFDLTFLNFKLIKMNIHITFIYLLIFNLKRF